MNQEMLDALDWEEEKDIDCSWNVYAHGYAYGFAYVYGRNNNPYSAIKRASDGMLAFIPTNKGEDFSTSDWTERFRSDSAQHA